MTHFFASLENFSPLLLLLQNKLMALRKRKFDGFCDACLWNFVALCDEHSDEISNCFA